MKRKAISLLLALAMILTFMPAMAFAGDEPAVPSQLKISFGTDDFDKGDIDPSTIDYVENLDNTVVVNVHPESVMAYRSESNTFLVKIEIPGVNATIDPEDDKDYWEIDNNATVKVSAAGDGFVGYLKIKDDTESKTFKVQPANETEKVTTINVTINRANTEVFAYNTDPSLIDTRKADSLRYWADENGNVKDCTGSGSTPSSNKEAWRLNKSAPVVEKINELVKAVNDAEKKAEQSASAAVEAIKTPGDAAVAAAQKAVDDNLAAQKAIANLESYLNSDDMFYITDAVGKGSQTQRQSAAANNKVRTDAESKCDTDLAPLKEKLGYANAILAQAIAGKEAADDRAAAEAADAHASAVAYTPAQAKIKSVKAGKKKATIRFKKVSKNVTGYEIQITDKKTGAVVKTVYAKKSKKKVIKKTVKGLSKKTKYTAMVRAFNTVDGKTYYGAWSKAKGFKTRK